MQEVYGQSDYYINGLVQDCRISIVNALEILQSCTKPWTYNNWQLLPDITQAATVGSVQLTWKIPRPYTLSR